MTRQYLAHRLTALTAAILIALTAAGQDSDSITATVTDRAGQPLEYANAVLLAADSTFLCGSVTDSTGRFTLPCPARGDCLLRVSLFGYGRQTLRQPFPSVITLGGEAVELGETVVTAARNYVKPISRGISIDIEHSPLSQLGSTIECLKQMPLIDGTSGSLSVIGSGTPAIYIDNRRTDGTGELERLLPADIKNVQILTVPPAKYGADVPAVILITTRRRNGGTAVTAGADVTAAEAWSYSGHAGINSNNGRGLTLFADASYGSAAFRQTRRYGETFGNGGMLRTLTDQHARRRTESLTADAGFSLDFGKNSAGAKYIYSRTPDSPYTGTAASTTNAREAFSSITSVTGIDSRSWSHYVNAYLDMTLPAGVSLRVDADYKKGRSRSTSATDERETAGNIMNANLTDYSLKAVKGELTRRFGTVELSAGGLYSLTDNRQDFTSGSTTGQDFLTDSQDNVRQHLGAVWLSADWTVSKLVSISGGLRYEDTDTRYTHNGQRVNTLSPHFRDWFPNVDITLSTPLTVSLSYRAETSRPAYSQLENNYNYVTPTLWETGNPALQSDITHEAKLSLSYRKTMVQLSLVRNHRPLGSVYSYDEDINANVRQETNLPDYSYAQLVAVQRLDAGAWHPTLQLRLYAQNLSYGTPERSYRRPLTQLFLNNRLDLPHGVYAYLNIAFIGKGDADVTRWQGAWQTSLTLNRQFSHWTVMLHANDMFGTWRQKYRVSTNNVSYTTRIKGASQLLMLSATYRFNAAKSQYKGKAAAGDELERLY